MVGLFATTEEQVRRYWRTTSSTSPSHILQSWPHTLIALFGLGGIVCFCLVLTQRKPFDASIAAVLVLLCVHLYSLQSEHSRRKYALRQECQGVSVHCLPDGRNKGAAGGTSELDLTGYANKLGVSLRSGAVHKEGSTLNKILMDALAKEYLRCVAALKCYQTTFGPLKDGSEQGCGDQPKPSQGAGPLTGISSVVSSPTKSSPFRLQLDLTKAMNPSTRPQSSEERPPLSAHSQASPFTTIQTVDSTAGATFNLGSPRLEGTEKPPISPRPRLLSNSPISKASHSDHVHTETEVTASFGIFGGGR